jgi:hypothetical protein
MGHDFLTMQTIDFLSINTIRTLSMDAFQQANSGHPGTPMAMAPVAYVLWQEYLRFDPQDPIWPNFCHRLGLDYVSSSPFRVPIARLAAAQAAIQK